ncbi:MAG: hypothetical protein KBG61_12560, partial [Flavobacterium sp.]|nr:hypothetical protein [Flavobacterium sp.]
ANQLLVLLPCMRSLIDVNNKGKIFSKLLFYLLFKCCLAKTNLQGSINLAGQPILQGLQDLVGIDEVTKKIGCY